MFRAAWVPSCIATCATPGSSLPSCCNAHTSPATKISGWPGTCSVGSAETRPRRSSGVGAAKGARGVKAAEAAAEDDDSHPLECLPDAEVDAPAAWLRLGVDTELGNGIELVAGVEAYRADRRLIPQTRSDRVAQIAEVHAPRAGPHVAAVEKEYGAQPAAELGAQLRAERQHAVAANRQARIAERADLVPPPSAKTCL